MLFPIAGRMSLCSFLSLVPDRALNFHASPSPLRRCGACQRFQPTFFRVGDLYRREREDGVGPVKVYAARVNCGVHSRLCGKYGVSHYPTMLLGTPSEVLNATKKHPLTEIRPTTRTLEEVRKAVASALSERNIIGVGVTSGGSDAAKAAQDFVDLTKNSFRPDTVRKGGGGNEGKG